jgi:tyrosyl-tRNA synthetase
LRVLQKRLGEEVTVLVHGKEEYEKAIAASSILFGKSTASDLKSLDEQTFLDVFDGVPQATISMTDFSEGLDMIGALAAKTNFLQSNGDARRALKENAISVNKEKIKEDFIITADDLIANKYVLLQRGKKTYYLLIVA